MVVKLLHQSSLKLTTKVAVLPSPAQVNPPAISPVVALVAPLLDKKVRLPVSKFSLWSLGIGQIMPANLSAWSQDILGYRHLMSF